MTLLSVLFALLANPWFLLLAAFVALNQWLFVRLLRRLPGLVLLEHVGIDRRCRP